MQCVTYSKRLNQARKQGGAGERSIPSKNFPSLEKCAGHSLKLLDKIQQLWAPIRKLFAPSGVPSWLQAYTEFSKYREKRFGHPYPYPVPFESSLWISYTVANSLPAKYPTGKPDRVILFCEWPRDYRIEGFTIRSYPVFEKWYPCPIWILFWLKPYYPYPKAIRKCIVMHNMHFSCCVYFASSWTRLVEVVKWQVWNACPA